MTLSHGGSPTAIDRTRICGELPLTCSDAVGSEDPSTVGGRGTAGGGPPGGGARSYPEELVTDVRALDGSTVQLRPIRPDDASRLVAFHDRLSAASVYRRFLSVHPKLSDAEVKRFTNVDYVDRLALVAVCEGDLVAVGRFDRRPRTDEAEVAFVVADDHQHRGIATLLLEQLAEAAWRNGITTFTADTLTENREMLGVFFDSGFRVEAASEGGTTTVRFGIEPDPAYLERRAARHGTPRRTGEGHGPSARD